MFPCIPCFRSRETLTDITSSMKDMSLRASKVQRRVKEHKEPSSCYKGKEPIRRSRSGGDQNGVTGEEDREWVAEEEAGVLITLVSLPHGGNRLKGIRFSEDFFDELEAQNWWSENRERIMSLYGVQTTKVPSSPREPDAESISSSNQETQSCSSSKSVDLDNPVLANTVTEDTAGASDPIRDGEAEDQVVEIVVEDQPGAFVTVRTSPRGSKEIIRVELNEKRFGKVKARVWWEENKERLFQQYSDNRRTA